MLNNSNMNIIILTSISTSVCWDAKQWGISSSNRYRTVGRSNVEEFTNSFLMGFLSVRLWSNLAFLIPARSSMSKVRIWQAVLQWRDIPSLFIISCISLMAKERNVWMRDDDSEEGWKGAFVPEVVSSTCFVNLDQSWNYDTNGGFASVFDMIHMYWRVTITLQPWIYVFPLLHLP